MVANAGICLVKPLIDSMCPKQYLRAIKDESEISNEATCEDLDRMMSVNSRGIFLSYKYAAMQMIKQGKGGRIIGTKCLSIIQTKPTKPIYCTQEPLPFQGRPEWQTWHPIAHRNLPSED
jgi:NAD(P)-dependent dehydrogenase (short-subunit alcohol dehydrogenase family)